MSNEQATKEFIYHLHTSASVLATTGKNAGLTRAEQLALEGQFDTLIHSILATLDGMSSSIDNAVVQQALNNDEVMLHDEYYRLMPSKMYSQTATGRRCPTCGAQTVREQAYYHQGVCDTCGWQGTLA